MNNFKGNRLFHTNEMVSHNNSKHDPNKYLSPENM